MTIATNLGYPRIGAQRALKPLLEAYWRGAIDAAALEAGARAIRLANWRAQAEAGIVHIPSNDFSLYDHVLDTAVLFDAVPARFRDGAAGSDLDTYFAMARGAARLRPLEMTKWFDTNYHYLVPELAPAPAFRLKGDKPVAEFREAMAIGIRTRPVLLGPVSFLLLAGMGAGGYPLRALLERLVPAYAALLAALAEAGAQWLQLDEPCLATDLDAAAQEGMRFSCAVLAAASPRPKLLLTSYFGGLGDQLPLALGLPVEGLHLDLVRAPGQLAPALAGLRGDATLSLGIVDGRNVWRTDLEHALSLVRAALATRAPERVLIAPSCSLLHLPLDCTLETALPPPLRDRLAFARQRLAEIAVLARAAAGEVDAAAFARSAARAAARRAAAASPDAAQPPPAPMARAPYSVRRAAQATALPLPPFPTTTIGSFPQTAAVRRMRARLRRGAIDQAAYDAFIAGEIAAAIRFQEAIGLDVLVHGEFERADMAEYFAGRLDGFALTQAGWVQAYGACLVKPPILFGDVSRPRPITVAWSRYAQSLTRRPVKGMLTGPVTLLNWSFVRDDQPRAATARQIARALRDEVADLEAAGLRIIQVDEPALREGLPLRRAEWPDYLAWAVAAFRLAVGGAAPATQIHTHMCYAKFGDILAAIDALDADVISLEAARSGMVLLAAFAGRGYARGIGPGLYDTMAPRVPEREEMLALLARARRIFAPEQLWVNPDCGLKARRWDEVKPALAAMVAAAHAARARLAGPSAAPRS